MNITNLEIIQASIDIFFCFFCIIMAITIKANKPKRNSMKIFIQLFVFEAILFLSEALAYIFRGNIGVGDVIVTRMANLTTFMMNLAVTALYVRYVYTMLKEKGVSVGHRYINVVKLFVIAGTAIVVANLFGNWMYYFDESNYYHRNSMWYAYSVITLIIAFSGVLMTVKNRKVLAKRTLITTVLFAFIPIIATIVQLFVYGISLTNMGLGLGLIVMFVAYMYDWTHDSIEQVEHVKNKWFDMVIMFMMVLISMSASIIACGKSIRRMSDDNSKQESETIALVVSEALENEFIKPITVAQTMSQDYNCKSYIKIAGEDAAKGIEKEMVDYLESIKDGFGYQLAFVASDKSKAFYTYKGITKYLDVVNDDHDIWYTECLESGHDYVVNVDTSESENGALSVFVNYKIYDKNGQFLGICGIGVDMDELVDIIKKFEEQYDIKIYLVNSEGMIQASSDMDSIEKNHLDTSYFDKVLGTKFYYQEVDDSCYMTKYLSQLNWYLVIKDYNPIKLDANKIITPIIYIFVFGMAIMAITFVLICVREQKAGEAYLRRYEASIKDEITGLYNRRSYEDDCDNILKDGALQEYSIVMMDLNGLKAANDKIGHDAGDELIIGAAKCMNNAFSGLGKTYRVGGDEFVALLKGNEDDVNGAAATFDHLTAKWSGKLVSELTVSKGIVVCKRHPELDFEEIKAMADKIMYNDKDAYYKRTGKERRQV